MLKARKEIDIANMSEVGGINEYRFFSMESALERIGAVITKVIALIIINHCGAIFIPNSVKWILSLINKTTKVGNNNAIDQKNIETSI